jgi:hypothetical protein
VQLAIAEAADRPEHLVSTEEALRVAMARQEFCCRERRNFLTALADYGKTGKESTWKINGLSGQVPVKCTNSRLHGHGRRARAEVDALGAEERSWIFWRAIFSRFRR